MARGAPPESTRNSAGTAPFSIQYVHLCPGAFNHYSSWQVRCHPSSPSWVLRAPMANLLKSALYMIRDKKAPSGGIQALATIIFHPWSRSASPTPQTEQDGICTRQHGSSSTLKPFFKLEVTTSSWRGLRHAAHMIHARPSESHRGTGSAPKMKSRAFLIFHESI